MKLSISLKLMIGVSLLICSMTASIAYFNSEYLSATILQREKDFNLSMTEARAREIENHFERRTTAFNFLAKQFIGADPATLDFKKLNEKYSAELEDVLEMDLYSIQKQVRLPLAPQITIGNPEALNFKSSSSKSSIEIEKSNLVQSLRVNINKILKKNASELYAGSLVAVNGAPAAEGVLLIAIPLTTISHTLDWAVVVAMRTTAIEKIVGRNKLGRTLLLNENGKPLVSLASTTGEAAIVDDDVIDFVKDYSLAHFSGEYQQHQPGEGKTDLQMLSFTKISDGTVLLNIIPASVLLAPAQMTMLMTLRLSGYFLAGSLFILFLFSLTLIGPLEKLVAVSLEVAKGNFEINLSSQFKRFFKDEVYSLAVAFERMTRGLKERDRFKTLFNKFHGSAVTEDLLTNEIALRGEKKKVFIFFSDIRNFTSMSENLDPSLVVHLLNEYFGYMVPLINRSGGVVDKFIGDAIMAVWGVPNQSDDDGRKALMACLQMRLALERLNDERKKRGEVQLWIGMSLHYGDAISGTIGSDERMEYTVIGNTVNTASRIEASTKSFGTDLLVSEEVRMKLPEFLYEEAGDVAVKGRSEALKLFKVMGYINHEGREVIVQTEYSNYEAEQNEKVKIAS